MTRWLDDCEQAAWRAFITACTMLSRNLEAELKVAHDLTLDDYAILSVLSESPDDRLRFGELADVLRVPRAHITYRFQRLARAGLVERMACEEDRRGAFAILTPAGRAAIEQAAPTHVEGVRRHLIDRLDRDQLVQLRDVMTTVLQADERAHVRW